MRIAGIDQSITSTSICLTDGHHERFILFGKEKKGKWWDSVSTVATQEVCQYDYPEGYSEQDTYKVHEYGKTAERIAEVVHQFNPDIVAIEGYSYSSQAGDLIDLVTFGSALRRAIISRGMNLIVFAPTELKSKACALAYGTDKKGVPRRPVRDGEKAGLAGGKFTKKEMLEAMAHFAPTCQMMSALGNMAQEAMALASVPKPLDDMVDSWWLSRVSAR